MGYTQSWSLKGLKKQNHEGLEGVIIGTNWEVVVTDDDGYSGKFTGATPFKAADVNVSTFTSYTELTEEQVLGWIKNHVSGSNTATNYWDHIIGRIQKEIDTKKYNVQVVTETDLPWSPTSGSSVTPDPLSGQALYAAQPD
jgi:hypothetical protein